MSTNPEPEQPEHSDPRAELELAASRGHEDRLELLERLHEALDGELDVDETSPAGR